jgi:hypothetical protein
MNSTIPPGKRQRVDTQELARRAGRKQRVGEIGDCAVRSPTRKEPPGARLVHVGSHQYFSNESEKENWPVEERDCENEPVFQAPYSLDSADESARTEFETEDLVSEQGPRALCSLPAVTDTSKHLEPKIDSKDLQTRKSIPFPPSNLSEGLESGRTEADTEGETKYWDRKHESIYIKAFNTAVDTVLERERHLFSNEEMDIINLYRNLPCTSNNQPS